MMASEKRQKSFRFENEKSILFFGMSALTRQKGFGRHVAAVGVARFSRGICSGRATEYDEFDERGALGNSSHGCR